MRRRTRALLFLLAAVATAVVGAAVLDGYGSRALRGYGPLRPVVVTAKDLGRGRRIGPREAAAALAVRRVPARFVPPDALAAPTEALGLVTRAALPVGAYLLAAQLAPPAKQAPRPGIGRGRRPVEIAVGGAGALLAAGAGPTGSKVDVVVTAEPSGAGSGRTFVAAEAVPLLALRPGPEGPGAGETAAATLGLTRRQALRLIAAESFARRVTLLPVG